MKLDSKGSDRRPRKSLLHLGIALALTTSALGAHAAGLGRLNVLSSIGQPLRAEIELTSVVQEEAGSLTARLAPADAFAQANIDYGSVLTTLRFSVQRRANGNAYVLVTSNQLVNEPFLDVLVELSWGSGRLVREYTLLIDPPNTTPAQRNVDPAQAVLPLPPLVNPRVPAVRRPPAPAVAPVASSPLAPLPTPVARPAAAASSGSTSGDYLVKSGDTALSIARENKPEGVSLEQMLAAFYRDNPQAFSGNVNRLMAGATVKIPDAPNAQALDGAEARRIVAQSSNFGSYRERIARNAAEAPTTRAAGQQASGKLSTRVEDTSAPTAEAKDRLQLSRPDATTKAATSGPSRAGVSGPSLEDLAAKDRELQETKTRLALLEKNVSDLQQLLALKNQTLADLQKSPTPVAPPIAAAPVAPLPVALPPPAAPVAAPVAAPAVVAPAPAPEPAPVVSTPPPAPAPVKAVPAKAPTTVVVEENWFDSIKENSLLLIGLIALVILLIGYGLFTMRRRRKLAGFEDSIFVDNSVLHANSVFGTTGGQSVDTANSGFHSNFVPVAGNLPEQNEVDPVAEADVYIAYGRDAQAEEILKEALRSDGSRQAVRLKLLEIYAKRGDAKTFETMSTELYAATGGQGEDWKQAAALGLSIDPHNPLYADAGTPAPVAAMAPAPTPPARVPPSIGTGLGATGLGVAGLAASDFMASDVHVGTTPSINEPPPASATEYMRTDPMPRPESSSATSAPSMDLDFDLGFANTGMAALPTATTPPAPPPAAPVDPTRGNGLDFDVGSSVKPLIDPFTASAFGAGDPTSRTAVNLPAFRARAEQEPAARPDDGFSASDIFGSSIVADPEMGFSDTPPEPKDAAPAQARTQAFRNVVDNHQFDKTEPLDVFSKINLELDNSSYEATNIVTDFGAKTDVWQAMATKLDLALAYSDIGDKDGARELLEEVVRNGDQTQADRARTLIGELG